MNKLLKVILAVLASVAFYSGLYAEGAAGDISAGGLFYQANLAYKEAKYDAAIADYEKIIHSGFESGNLYYNLGNSYFKKGELGRAILNYERARLFIPNDSDLKSNYDYVLSALRLKPPAFGNRLEKLAVRLFEALAINLKALLLSGIYLLGITVLILGIFISGAKRFIKPVIFVLAVLFILSAVALNSKMTYLNKGAVIVTREASVKFEPDEAATVYFNLDEGSAVEVIRVANDWCKIKRPDGKLGWVNKAALESIADNL